jgi:hypothetical protein
MYWQSCHDVATTAAREVLRGMDWVSTGYGSMELRRRRITELRDRLHQACCFFENDDACVEYEDLYLPLFDALAFINEALHRKPIPAKPLNIALARLETLLPKTTPTY